MIDEKTINGLYRYAVSLSNDDSRAYDLVHDAILKAKNYIVFNREAYLKKVIRNIFYDQYRSEKNKEEFQDGFFKTDIFFEDIYINRDEVIHLLNNLEPEERELLFLAAVEEYTYKEISKLLNLKIGTVMSRLNRCKEKIRRLREE